MVFLARRIRVRHARPVTFACPACGTDRQGVCGPGRRWLALAGAPVVPLRACGDVVGCGTCSSRFDAAVLDRPTNSALAAALADSVRLLAVAVLRCADTVGDAALTGAVALVSRSRPGYDAARLETDLEVADLARLPGLLALLDQGLAMEGKEHLLVGLVRLCLTCGPMTAHQRETVHVVGESLGMTVLHVDGILAVLGAGQHARRDDLPPQP